jgi:hypothetical protein
MNTAIESTTVPATTAEKTFTVAGVSCLKGEYKVRFANSTDRIKTLVQNAHTDIRLIELGSEMTKAQAIDAIKDLEGFDDINAQQAFDDFLAAKAPKPPKPAKAPKAPKTKKAVATVEETVTLQELIEDELVETQVDLTEVYESVGLVPPTVYEDAVAEEFDTDDQPF